MPGRPVLCVTSKDKGEIKLERESKATTCNCCHTAVLLQALAPKILLVRVCTHIIEILCLRGLVFEFRITLLCSRWFSILPMRCLPIHTCKAAHGAQTCFAASTKSVQKARRVCLLHMSVGLFGMICGRAMQFYDDTCPGGGMQLHSSSTNERHPTDQRTKDTKPFQNVSMFPFAVLN